LKRALPIEERIITFILRAVKRLTKEFGYCWMMWFLCAHCLFAQTKPETAPPLAADDTAAPTASPAFSIPPTPSPPHKLDIDTIAAIPLEERRAFLAKLSADERVKFARQVRDLPPTGQTNGKINALFMGWSVVDPVAAIENAKGFPTPRTRTVATEAIAYGMEPKSAGTMVQSLRTLSQDALDPEAKERLLGLSIVKWSQVDPAAAAHSLAELYPDAPSRLAKPGGGDGVFLTATKGVATNWGATDPHAALDWFQKKSEPENLFAVENVILGWWQKDHTAAAAYVSAHVGTAGEREVAGVMADAMAEQDPRVATDWVKWNKDDRSRRRAQLRIADIWSSKDPRAAAKWAAGLPAEEGKSAMSVVASRWAQNDSQATAKWLDSLKGSLRDAAIAGFASATAARDYAFAMGWAMKISDPQSKERLSKAIATQWLRLKPNEARPWIQSSKMPEDQKKQLLGSD
jgi:hypothetical protein